MLRIDQQIRIPHAEVGTDASGPACIFAAVEVAQGDVVYLRGEEVISAPKQFTVFLPPFAVVQARLEQCDVTTAGVAFRPPASARLPRRPLLLPAACRDLPESVEDLVTRLALVEGAVDVGRCPDPSRLASRTKAILDAEYDMGIAIGHIADRVQAAAATLSRTFKRAYGLTPVRYRHHVQIMDALVRFAEGAVPIDVFQDVGFDDLSRFYKVFRKVACAPPGSYRPVRSRNAKT